MSTGANTSVRRHINAKLRSVDRKGGNQNRQYRENDSNPNHSPNQIRNPVFPDDFFNNIGQFLSFKGPKYSPNSRRSMSYVRTL